MPTSNLNRIMMISTHGYVAAKPEFGKPDTGGQVVYVLELAKCFARMGYAVDNIVLALGRVAKIKGYDLLLRSMPILFQRIPDVRLVLAVGSTNPSEVELELIESFYSLARSLGIRRRTSTVHCRLT